MTPNLSPPQIRFLRLHQQHFVQAWRELFRGAMLRAATEAGITATISASEATELCELDYMRVEHGAVHLTTQGWAI